MSTVGFAQDNIPEARKLYLKSQALQEKALGPQHPDMAKPLSNRAGLLMREVMAAIHSEVSAESLGCMYVLR